MEGRGAGGDRGFCCGSHPCSATVRMARPLEQAVAAVVCTFREYAGRCGDKHKLCQAELKELLQKELPTWTPTEFRECDYNKFMSVLDTNKDCEVDFAEYVRSLACLCTYCHDYFKDCPPEPPCSQ
ncbi:S100 calcium binding protein A3 [Phyllostomus discolor]|uniref:Protein S100-A3 n=2 Tax=Phyllostomus discolor TaxID=89673 RepID=A0A834DCR8_9CHIR|nr:S100 calcium binding protein A3 [Phyllostomus discolor]